MNDSRLLAFATRYTAAWCSHDASRVASFYSASGSLAINDGSPAVGRLAVQAAVQSFMTAYPDLVVKFDRLDPRGERVLYHWIFSGTNSGPGGTGSSVRIAGYEDWEIGVDGLIANSQGHYDSQEWERQAKRRMKLYEFGPTRSIRARWMLQELDLEFEPLSVDLTVREHRSVDFLKLNPAGKVPVLIDGELVLNESVAIVLYLAEKYPDRGFLPADLALRADCYRWILFAVTELEQPWWRIARHTHLYPEQDRLAAEVALARRDFLPMAAVLEQHMKGRTFVVGDRVTAADFVVAYTLDVAEEMELLRECPTLRTYVERMYARPRAPRRIADIFRAMRS